ncbi:hypothetical protein [Brevibacterium antiquum]|uniref:hypothetical protein n=1 Tax=Brevibacterium antiquum TaxID=234835 RepID=UPI0018DFD8BD|nr:hypothetical protein [Brevibacterium antiquum]
MKPSDIEKVAVCECHSAIGFIAAERNDVDLDSENFELVRCFAPASKGSGEFEKLSVGADCNGDIDINCGANGIFMLLGVEGEISSSCTDDEQFDIQLPTDFRKFGEYFLRNRDVRVPGEIDQQLSPKN